jgi:hypothetical protein
MLRAALEPATWTCEFDLGHGFVSKSLITEPWIANVGNHEDGALVRYMTAPSTPLIHHYSRKTIYFLLESGNRPLPTQIKIRATTKGVGEYTVTLDIHQTTKDMESIQRLAAKALLLDLESMATMNHSSELLIQSNAEKVGCTYGIASKWTSFVAVDESVENDIEIGSYTALRIEFSGLTTRSDFEDWSSIDSAEARRVQNRIAQRNYRKKGKRKLESTPSNFHPSNSGSWKTSSHAFDSTSSSFPATPSALSWSTIRSCQRADGSFTLSEDARDILASHFCPGTQEALILETKNQAGRIKPEAHLLVMDTQMIIVYVQNHFPTSQGLWDLMMAKARLFVNASGIPFHEQKLTQALEHARFLRLRVNGTGVFGTCWICDARQHPSQTTSLGLVTCNSGCYGLPDSTWNNLWENQVASGLVMYLPPYDIRSRAGSVKRTVDGKLK